jgi:hypothetical protein
LQGDTSGLEIDHLLKLCLLAHDGDVAAAKKHRMQLIERNMVASAMSRP